VANGHSARATNGCSKITVAMDRFATTQWTLVVDARSHPTSASREALSTLCQRYWPPLYGYLRRCGHSAEDAEDLTQGFFVHLLEKHGLNVADPARGRFRSFLLASLNNFVANEHERQRAQKRGGGHPVVSIDATSADDIARYDLSDPRTPEMIFDRRWALTLLDQVLRRLRAEFERDGKHALF